MASITAIEIQERNRNRVNIFIDGEYAFSLEADAAMHLSIGRNISQDDVDHLVSQDNLQRCKETALHFLSYRPRSRAEVFKHLATKGFSDDAVTSTVDELVGANLVNDQDFARYWVEQREEFKPRGVFALRLELLQKGIDLEIIEKIVAEVDEYSSAVKAGQKKAEALGGSSYPEFMRKLCPYLERRGFNYGLSVEVARQLWRETNPDQKEEQISRGD